MPKRRDQDEVQARLAQLDLLPIQPYPGSSVPWPCKCLRCGAIVLIRYHYIDTVGRGCKHCSQRAAGARAESHFVIWIS
jgi:hypothetical protein